MCVEYVLHGASVRTPYRDFMTLEAQAGHLLDFVQADGHCQASLDQAGSELMVPWEIGSPPPQDMLGMLPGSLIDFSGGGSYTCFVQLHKTCSTCARHFKTEHKSHS